MCKHLKERFTILSFFIAFWCHAQEPKLMLPIGHFDAITSVKYSSDGKYIVTTSDLKQPVDLKVWSSETGRLVSDFLISAPSYSPLDKTYFLFSNDAKKLIGVIPNTYSNVQDSLIECDLQTKTVNRTKLVSITANELILHSSNYNLIDISRQIWTDKQQQIYYRIEGFESCSPDGKFLLTYIDEEAHIWDISFAKPICKLDSFSNQFHKIPEFIQFSDDGHSILGVQDVEARVWNTSNGKLIIKALDVNEARLSHNGKMLLTYSNEIGDSTIRLWSIQDATPLSEIKLKETVNSFVFSKNDETLLTTSRDGTANIWNTMDGKLLKTFAGHLKGLLDAQFSLDEKFIVTGSWDKTAKVWNTSTAKLVHDLKGTTDRVRKIVFFEQGKKFITVPFEGGTPKIWQTSTGKLLLTLKGHTEQVSDAVLSQDETLIATVSYDSTCKIWDSRNGKLLKTILHLFYPTSIAFSPDNKFIEIIRETESHEKTYYIWDLYADSLIASPSEGTVILSPDWKYVVVRNDNEATILNLAKSTVEAKLKEPISAKNIDFSLFEYESIFSANGKLIVIPFNDGVIKIWNTQTNVTTNIKCHNKPLFDVQVSDNGRYIATTSLDSTVEIWGLPEQKMLLKIKTIAAGANTFFSKQSNKLVVLDKGRMQVWDINANKMISQTPPHSDYSHQPWGGSFINHDKFILTKGYYHHYPSVWNAETGELVTDLDDDLVEFSPDSTIVISQAQGVLYVRNTNDFKIMKTIRGSEDGYFFDVSFSQKKILNETNSIITLYDIESGKKIYGLLAVDSVNYLVFDSLNHYDGTPAARNLLYYTCGTEIIGLDQVKDKLWVPNLAERIMKGEKINAPSLADLNICGLTPLVEPDENGTGYQFKITPRRGGLGETILYVNGIETKKYKPDELTKKQDGYELNITKQELSKYFVSGKGNEVTVKAYTKENDISSRGIKITNNDKVKDTVPPNLFAVIIGVSDYKGNELHLSYAAKDAGDIGNAISMSASKLLGKDHVFMYNLNTGKEHYAYPEKKSIKDVFTEIGKKATANDVLMVFFAGHGVVMGEKKQFYFLTADASNATLNDNDVKDVGVSAAELMEWMKPDNIKAQKRILILDACNSGQAINQMVSIGKEQGYIATRNDDKAEEIKQIDKLNEKAGLYILAASASNQSAYEMGRYNQGLLTYSLLKVIKEHPEVLEDNKYLNVSGWFNAATKIVTDIVRENNLRQEPQLITTTNFNIGIVDNEVLSKIFLPNEKPL
ncbi:MAG: caspase family protein, partial [Ferruginibacter sp.]